MKQQHIVTMGDLNFNLPDNVDAKAILDNCNKLNWGSNYRRTDEDYSTN